MSRRASPGEPKKRPPKSSPGKARFKLLPAVAGAGDGAAPARPWSSVGLRPTSPASPKLPIVPLVMSPDSTSQALGSFDDMCNALTPKSPPLPKLASPPGSAARAALDAF